jgi:hypothetical protein
MSNFNSPFKTQPLFNIFLNYQVVCINVNKEFIIFIKLYFILFFIDPIFLLSMAIKHD